MHQPNSPPPTAVVAEYTKLAAHYDRRWSRYVEASTAATLARVTRPSDGCVLDLGCGTGVLLQKLAHRFPQAKLVGVDSTAAMLAIARQRLPPRALLHLACAEQLPFADDSFDLVVSSSMFHYLPRPLAALAEVRRVLKPQGKLVLSDWCSDFLTCRVYAHWLRCRNHAHVKTYRTQELHDLLATAGFQFIRVERYRILRLWGLMTATAVRPV